MHHIVSTDYSFELEIEKAETNGRVCAVFVYASVKKRVREEQWHDLYVRSRQWWDRWILGEDLNDIRDAEEKGDGNGRVRSEASCRNF